MTHILNSDDFKGNTVSSTLVYVTYLHIELESQSKIRIANLIKATMMMLWNTVLCSITRYLPTMRCSFIHWVIKSGLFLIFSQRFNVKDKNHKRIDQLWRNIAGFLKKSILQLECLEYESCSEWNQTVFIDVNLLKGSILLLILVYENCFTVICFSWLKSKYEALNSFIQLEDWHRLL